MPSRKGNGQEQTSRKKDYEALEPRNFFFYRGIPMTTLGYERVGKTRRNDIMLHVAGDLSHTYEVVPKNQDSTVGLSFGSKRRAIQYARRTQNLGWSRQVGIYEKHTSILRKNENYKETEAYRGKFRYLPPRMAKQYVGRNEREGAYGDYAQKIRNLFKIR